MTITESDLLALLDAKVQAKATWDTAWNAAAALTSTDDPKDLIKADIIKKTAHIAYMATEDAYEAALAQHCKEVREARNV